MILALGSHFVSFVISSTSCGIFSGITMGSGSKFVMISYTISFMMGLSVDGRVDALRFYIPFLGSLSSLYLFYCFFSSSSSLVVGVGVLVGCIVFVRSFLPAS